MFATAVPSSAPAAVLSTARRATILSAAHPSRGRNTYGVRRAALRAFASQARSTDAAGAKRQPTAEQHGRPRTYPPRIRPWPSGPIPTGPGCRCFHGGDGSFGCTQHRRWLSSSGSDNNSGSDKGSAASTTAATTPLPDVSQSDLNLALKAAAEPDPNDASSPDVDLNQPQLDLHLSDIPGATTGSGKKLAIVFTCTVCSTRSAKKFTERAYNHGVVLVRCPGCQNLHLIADRLGFFEDKAEGGWDVEKALAERGERVVAVTDDNVLELTMADVLGGERAEEFSKRVGATADDRDGDETKGGKDGMKADESENGR